MKMNLLCVMVLGMGLTAQAKTGSTTVTGHISEGKADGSVPCTVQFGNGQFSVTNSGQTSRSCNSSEGFTCSLNKAGAETFVMIQDNGRAFGCQIPTSSIP